MVYFVWVLWDRVACFGVAVTLRVHAPIYIYICMCMYMYMYM